MTLQTVPDAELLADVVQVAGLSLSAGALSAGIALVFRWYAREEMAAGVAALVGVSVVALYFNTTAAFTQVVQGDTELLTVRAALTNTATLVLAAGTAVVGARVGDRVATDVFAAAGARELDTDVGQLVRAVGRVLAVELPDDPDDIDDMEHYDPVTAETKRQLAGKTLVFPRRLTVEELRARLVDRLRTDYGVGAVDVDLTEAGEIEYLALGSRMAGIGPSLPPGSAAIAVRADPAFAASPGDRVQVWRPPSGEEGAFERVTTAEVRGTAGDVVTLAADETDVESLSPEESYRLVTLPDGRRPDREFAALLRAAEETMGVVTLAPGSALVGAPVGALDVSIVAVRPAEGSVEPLPPRSRVLASGDTVYAVARPDAIRRLEAGADGNDTTATGSTDGTTTDGEQIVR